MYNNCLYAKKLKFNTLCISSIISTITQRIFPILRPAQLEVLPQVLNVAQYFLQLSG